MVHHGSRVKNHGSRTGSQRVHHGSRIYQKSRFFFRWLVQYVESTYEVSMLKVLQQYLYADIPHVLYMRMRDHAQFDICTEGECLDDMNVQRILVVAGLLECKVLRWALGSHAIMVMMVDAR